MKYKESQKILYEQGNAKSLEGNSHMSDDIESRKSEDKKMPKDARLCLVASCDRAGTNSTTQSTINNSDLSDSRDVTSEQLRAEVDENADLSDFQKEQLYALLSKYRNHLTKRPRRCNLFEYKFEMKGDKLKSRNAWPISFALRAQVKEQIQEMLKDNILEESFSDYVNPLTLVERPGKSIRICIDARRVNTLMIPDRVKVDPMKELLQRFHGSKFITTLDLSSAFLQVPLHRSSRKWTSFQFGNQVYQYKVVPYGFKNSLSAFIRALDKVLGDGLADNVVTYVDDVVVHSGCFEDHLRHIDTVLEKLTRAGFTINANKCSFCKPQIKFLGHVISSEALMPDMDSIKAILCYPPPRNQKQLRRFLGICNFLQQFISNYAQFVSPLLILLKKGHKWRWTSDLQNSFEIFRDTFAHNIELVHPDSDAEYVIHTDASAKAIGGVIMQKDKVGNLRFISTTSRVLNPTEQRYTTCEQELLAIVHSPQKFRIYVYGRKIKLYTDSQALTFLNRCVITSNRVARWLQAIQQYDIEICHIKGANNVLADILSRYPSELSVAETRELSRPGTIMVLYMQST